MATGFLYSNDRPGQYPASWYAATANTLSDAPQLQGTITADVCIIGGGYTGLSAALHLAEAGYQVVLLEAHRVGWGASGRNGGQVGTGWNKDQAELEVLVGRTQAQALWDLSLEAVQLCKDLIHKYQISCDLQAGIIHADHRRRFVQASREFAEKLQRDYAYTDIQFLDQAALQQELHSPLYYGGMLNLGAAHLHPLNYALGLAAAAKRAGVIIYERSPAINYTKGAKLAVNTAQGQVTADYLVLACNGYLDDLEPKIASRVMPINNYIVATEPLSMAQIQDLIPNRYAVADSAFVVNYFRMSADQRLLFGGGESYSFKFPKDIPALVRPRMLAVFPQLAKANIEYSWGGTLAVTVNRLPYFTRLQPNVFSASGYSGHGVALATLAGKLLAEALAGTAERFEVMAKLPNWSFPGGTWLRWPLLVTAMMYYSLRDRF
ncbi:gamma-glutamylputrescine oxidase [Thiothrix eikelboomii]|uniref:Gamma-glutamylputrescine oxidase n=1 Tax=Thiothrix eikelboomii TaxID=92487 RepID=A0A1T4VRJ5_9GAMM|nr:FAD-binding oxidoreductase [Thiothrix eikelboomii]SKA67567.1 gamma-glutamylputrescine oxidase [Thiothrix eikelboomii]